MRDWRADLSGTAFGKITSGYGHIDENGRKIYWTMQKTFQKSGYHKISVKA